MSHGATPPPYEDDTIKKQELEHLEFVTKEDNISTLDLSTTVVPIETDEFGNEIVHIDQVASDRLRRKVYIKGNIFAFIDRANIGNARIAGLEKDLKLTGNQYNILLSSLFPGIGYYFGRWYRREEITFRMGLYIACAPLAGGIGGLLASGILKVDGIGKVHTWQQIFLIEGIITTVIGIAAYMLMADRPETARWLSPEEKKLAADRIKADQVGSNILLEGMNVRAIKEGIFATTTLVNGLMFMLNNITVTGVAFFAPTIVATIYPTKSTIQKQLYTVPPYIVGALCTCIALSPHAFPANGWAAINVASDTARAAALGCVVMMGNCGGLISTWSFMPSDGPDYP
ncbi:hypothetical protein QFC24_006232 [Naganishia onofrii]|uniref:Uncharacterized protein n=1 Tax=Naganishia onofrii TaxID=1851511 RepID=A0ACC2X304_9TREE|nr:hypothetical protein QFC24_006232 [Naganishia onofrii]